MAFFDSYYFVPETVDSGYVENEGGGINRIYAQYRNKPKAQAWYKITRSLGQDIAQCANLVRASYDIDLSSGYQLDVLGRIVGVGRTFVGHVNLNPGMFALLDGSEFGDEDAQFSSLTVDQDDTMADDIYRIVIRSKILKNNSDATIESVLAGVNFLIPGSNTLRVTDNEDMSFSIEFYGMISALERWLLLNFDLIPKPQGVKFQGFLEAYGYSQFGDSFCEFGDSQSEFVGITGV